MQHITSRKIFLFLLGCLTVLVSTAQPQKQETPEQFNRSSWQSMVEKTNYFKPEKEQQPVTKSKKSIQEINLGPLKYLLIGLAIALIVYVLLRIFAAELFKMKNTKNQQQVFNVLELDDNIEVYPLQNLLNEAIEQRQFKLAIRLYYLLVLQELQATRQIIWHKEKTNYQYIKELANSPLVKDFRYLTILFESIWFGETEELFADDFQKIQPYFVNYLSRIKQLS